MLNLYLAGGLFNAGERQHIMHLEEHLLRLGHNVIVPQREALKFQNPTDFTFDVKGIVRDCRAASENSDNLYVGCADGADADSGTCVEYGHAMTATGRALLYRTDFRTAVEREVGLNAMLQQDGTIFIYFPCFAITLEEFVGYYHELASKIHEAVSSC
ncbi:MAG: nucleoside 2-deoxyribosyltransferase [Patescibacteria group bacterium]